MPTWDYSHRIEYRRVLANGRLVHVYTEVVQDQGWTFCHRPERQEEWFARYTRACAEDFLARRGAKAGTWVVTVHRTGTAPKLLGSIRLKTLAYGN